MKRNILFFSKNALTISSLYDRLTKALGVQCFNVLNLIKNLFICLNITLYNNRSFKKLALLGVLLCALLVPGNVTAQTITVDGNPSDWGPVLTAGSPIVVKVHIRDANDTNDNQFTMGSQDPDLISEWGWSLGNTNDKGDISNLAATIIGNKLYFAGDRTAINGDAQIGFWFFLGGVEPVNGGGFSGAHVNGDILALSNFTNGGGGVQIRLYKWLNGALAFQGTYNTAFVNSAPMFAPTAQVPAWTYQGKKLGNVTPDPNQYLTGAFFEGSIDLGDITIADHCFTSFLLETRNSQSDDASLQDFVGGGFHAKPENPTVTDVVRCGPGPVTLVVSCANGSLITRWYANAQGGNPLPGAPDTSNVTQDATYYVSCYNAELNCESDRVPIHIDIIDGPNAGGDGNTLICDSSNLVINLFSLISGEQPGGSWERSSGTGGSFNAAAGTFTPAAGATTSTFTYTLIGTPPCGNDSSVATININPQVNAGDDGNTAICADSNAVINLFNLITGEQPGGTWERASGSGGTFNAIAGTYSLVPGGTASSFTYTVAGTAPCANDSSVATVNVNPLPPISCPASSLNNFVRCNVSVADAQTETNTSFNTWFNLFTPNLGTNLINVTYVYSPLAAAPASGHAPLNPILGVPGEVTTSVTVEWTVQNPNTGCVSKCSAVYTIGYNCLIGCTSSQTPAPCNGNAEGSVTAEASNGTPPYIFQLYSATNPPVLIATSPSVGVAPFSYTFQNLLAGNYIVAISDFTQGDPAGCPIEVLKIPSVPIVPNCSNDSFQGCAQTQAALNTDYAAWYNSLAPTGGTNLQYNIVVTDAQNNVVVGGASFAPNKCGGVYTATVTYSDDCAQSGNCQGVYTVIGDTVKPVISTNNVSGYLGCNPTVTPPQFTANDLCDGALTPIVTPSQETTDGCIHSKTWTANVSDGCSNAADAVSITYTWKVDLLAPVIVDKPDYTIDGCNPDWPSEVSTTYTDNCDGPGNINGVAGDVHTSEDGCTQFRDYTFDKIDGCLNPAVQQVTRVSRHWDKTGPVIVDKPDYTLDGCNPDWPSAVSTTYTDNCEGPGNINGVAGDVHTSEDGCTQYRDYTFDKTDGCLNPAVQQVTRVSRRWDKTGPVIACPSNIDITACDPIPVLVVPTATDNCSGNVQVIPTRSDGLALNDPFPIGVEITITYTATDGCNNSNSCNFKVLVRPCTPGGHIFPTQTTCCNYVTNSASQLLNVCTTVRTNYVTNAIPGVFFYYSEVTAPSTSFTIEVRQSNDGDLNRLFQVHGYDKNNLQQIRLYTKGCENVPFTASFISSGTGARLVVNGATLGGTYIVSIKYNVKSIIGGTYSGADLKSTYTFGSYTQFEANPFVLSADSVGTLDALAGCKDGTPTPGDCSLPSSNIASDEPSAPNLVDINEPSFIAYPVPFRDVISIKYQFKYVSKAIIQIFDTKGSLLMSQQDNDVFFNKEITIKPNFHRSEGQVFYIKIITDKGVSIKKVFSDN